MEQLKQNIDCENSIIWALLFKNKEVINIAQAELKAEYFYYTINQEIFKAVMELSKNDNEIDCLIVSEYLKNNQKDDKHKLTFNQIKNYSNYELSSANFSDHIKILLDNYSKREFQILLNKVKQDKTSEVDKHLDNFVSLVEDFKEKRARIGKTLPNMAELIKEGLFENVIEKPKDFIKTPFEKLNNNLNGGLHQKRFMVLTAPAGGGKTAFLLQLLDSIASNKIYCLFVCLEMSTEELLIRSLSRLSGTNSGYIEARKYLNTSWEKENKLMNKLTDAIKKYQNEIAPYMTIWEADRGITTAIIANEVKKIQNKFNNKNGVTSVVVAVDPLNGLSTGDKVIDQNPIEKAGTIGGDLKRLARDLDIPVIGISDTTKEGQKKADRLQSMGQGALRYSYEITHRADIVAEIRSGGKDFFNSLIKQKEKYFKDVDVNKTIEFIESKKYCEIALLELSKQRSGAREPACFYYFKEQHKFQDFKEIELNRNEVF